MKAAFANTGVTEINVLRNITAELYANQVNTFTVGGYTVTTPINYDYLGLAEGDTVGYSTGVYVRRTGSIEINGNTLTMTSLNDAAEMTVYTKTAIPESVKNGSETIVKSI